MGFTYLDQVIELTNTDHESKGFIQIELLEYIRSLKLGGTYIDIGSNHGLFGIYFSLFCQSYSVWCYESKAECLPTSKKNISYNISEDKCHLKLLPSNGISHNKNNQEHKKALESYFCKHNDVSLITLELNDISSELIEFLKNLFLKCTPLVILKNNSEEANQKLKVTLEVCGYLESFKKISGGSYIEFVEANNSHKKYFDVSNYWNSRYAAKQNSGPGSYNRLARFKARFINDFVESNDITSIVELGCGDGAQLSLAHYPSYTGLDISPVVIDICKNKFRNDATKHFSVYDPSNFDAETYHSKLAISLDVIYHLSNDDIYHAYLRDLFSISAQFIIIYSNSSDNYIQGVNERAEYVRFRNVIADIQSMFQEWQLVDAFPNAYPFNLSIPETTSFADFYIFERSPTENSAYNKSDEFIARKSLNQLIINAEQTDLILKQNKATKGFLESMKREFTAEITSIVKEKDFEEKYNVIVNRIPFFEKEIERLTASNQHSSDVRIGLENKLASLEEKATQLTQQVLLEKECRQNELRLALETGERYLRISQENSESKLLTEKQYSKDLKKELKKAEIENVSLSESLNHSNSKRKGHFEKLEVERRKTQRLSTQLDSLSRDFHKLAVDSSDAELNIYNLRHSLTYQLGVHLRNMRSLRGAIGFPLAVWRVYKTFKLRKSKACTTLIPKKRTPELLTSTPKPAPKKVTIEVNAQPSNTSKDEAGIFGWPDDNFDQNKLTVLAVMDEFTSGCFGADVNLIQPRPDNWKSLFNKYKPNFIFIESAWKGNSGSWQYRVASYSHKPGNEVHLLSNYAKENKTPVIFWNKEDPVHHEKFMEAAKEADIIFTTDQNMVPSYKKKTGNSRVFPLPFAAQPELHKPAPLHGRLNKSCFAGSWYGNRHAERGAAMNWLLEAAKPSGLDIYDRNYGTGIFPFPDKYEENIKGSLPYEELCKEYSRYRIFLNVNSVTDSPTMFSRRVFELLACGTPVVSTHANGIENLLGTDAVWLVNNKSEANEAIHTLMNNDDEWRRRSLAGIRKVFSSHTYLNRLDYICDKSGLNSDFSPEPSVLLLAKVINNNELDAISLFLEHQSWKGGQMYVEFQGDNLRSDTIHQDIKLISSIESFISHLGNKDFKYVSVINPTCHYDRNVLQDLVNATRYCPDSSVWGKSVSDSEFLHGKAIYKYASLWRLEHLKEKFFIDPDHATFEGDGVFAIDNEGFTPHE